MINFPSSPTIGQTHPASPVSGQKYWKWNGSVWIPQGGSFRVHVSDTEPLDAVAGEFWFKSDSGAMCFRFQDVDSIQWVGISGSQGPQGIQGIPGETGATGAFLSSSAPIGYTTGSGASVTQLTSKNTGVTINSATGKITMHNQSLPAGNSRTFVVTNNKVTKNDTVVVLLDVTSFGDPGLVDISPVGIDDGKFWVTVKNTDSLAVAAAYAFNFTVIKGSVS